MRKLETRSNLASPHKSMYGKYVATSKQPDDLDWLGEGHPNSDVNKPSEIDVDKVVQAVVNSFTERLQKCLKEHGL